LAIDTEEAGRRAGQGDGRSPPRAAIVGTGLIGGSIGLALRTRGWHVTGRDVDPLRIAQAREIGAVDTEGVDPDAEVVFVATPVAEVGSEARRALGEASGVVTDVGGVKAPIVAAVDDSRFVGGHPMAGSEQDGLAGADADLFVGATWVLTPTPATDPAAYTALRGVISSLGADVVALTPERHDDLVAVVSHVPHLAAASLMRLAAERAEEHAALLRLAAGGFRDMTRVAAGHPGIWPDICSDNSAAIVAVLDRLMVALGGVRDAVATGDRYALLEVLEQAQVARRNLPARLARPEDLAEVRVPVPDRPGVLSEVTTLAGELGVNIEDMEIAHSVEGDRGVLSLVVATEGAEQVKDALSARGYRPSVQPLA
jgi:prephenate dehydrogenase